jgi:hypothetical protein
VVKTKPKLSEVDREALERALEVVKARGEPSRRERRDWLDEAISASSSCQRRALQLKPWQSPPCFGDAHPGHDGHADAAVLLQRLLSNNLSRWEPDPVTALAAITSKAIPG